MKPKKKVHSLNANQCDYDDDSDETSSVNSDHILHKVNVCGTITAVQTSINNCAEKEPHKQIYAKFWYKNHIIPFQIDSGATVNVLPYSYVKDISLESSDVTLKMWNQTRHTSLGKFHINIRNIKDKERYSIEFIIIDCNITPLIDCRAAEQMNLLNINYDNFVSMNSVTADFSFLDADAYLNCDCIFVVF